VDEKGELRCRIEAQTQIDLNNNARRRAHPKLITAWTPRAARSKAVAIDKTRV
jgi:hypothetical protein